MSKVLDQVTDSTRKLNSKQRMQLIGRMVKEMRLSEAERSQLFSMLVRELFGQTESSKLSADRIRDYHRLLELMPTQKVKPLTRKMAERTIPNFAQRRKLAVEDKKYITLFECNVPID